VHFPPIGRVVIGDNVHISSGCCIHRGALVNTVLENEVKLDNNCHVAHNVHLGHHTILAAGVTFGGSVEVGPGVWFGVHSTINDGLTIGKNAIIGAGSVVIRDVAAGTVVAGSPARVLPRKKYPFKCNEVA